jgi:hypothetical protein
VLVGTVVPSNPTPLGSAMTSFDHFGISNVFYGPQVGLSAGLHYGPCSLDVTGKLAFGLLHQTAKVQGVTTLRLEDGTSATYDGGVLAQPGSGARSDDQFAVIPEVSLSAGCLLTPWLRVLAGYDFLYVSRITRAGSLVGGADSRQVFQLSSFDSTVHSSGQPSRLPGGGFWVQGLTCGLEVQF